MSVLRYRAQQAKKIPRQRGAYALCDLDEVPIYVGCSFHGIQGRVRRHLTSARSDIIANRLIDVWELAYIWAWPVRNKSHIKPLEAYLFHLYDSRKKLMNGTIPARARKRLGFPVPQVVKISVLSDQDRNMRREAIYRFPRQIEHIQRLVDHILTVKDSKDLHRALKAHFARLSSYYKSFVK